MLGELIIIVGAILQASSFGLAQLIVGRIFGSLRLCSHFLITPIFAPNTDLP